MTIISATIFHELQKNCTTVSLFLVLVFSRLHVWFSHAVWLRLTAESAFASKTCLALSRRAPNDVTAFTSPVCPTGTFQVQPKLSNIKNQTGGFPQQERQLSNNLRPMMTQLRCKQSIAFIVFGQSISSIKTWTTLLFILLTQATCFTKLETRPLHLRVTTRNSFNETVI